MRSIFSKIFEPTKNYRIDRIDRSDRAIDRSIGSIDGRRVRPFVLSSVTTAITAAVIAVTAGAVASPRFKTIPT